MLYCTCSVFRAEGQQRIDAFVAHNTDALALPSPGHLIPQDSLGEAGLPDNQGRESDGFFYALLRKRPPQRRAA